MQLYVKTNLLPRLQAQTLPDEAPPIGTIHPFTKMAVTFEPNEDNFWALFRKMKGRTTRKIFILPTYPHWYCVKASTGSVLCTGSYRYCIVYRLLQVLYCAQAPTGTLLCRGSYMYCIMYRLLHVLYRLLQEHYCVQAPKATVLCTGFYSYCSV